LSTFVSRAASPFIKAGLIIAVLVIAGAKVRSISELPSNSQEITRCLGACRAALSRRLVERERDEKNPARSSGRLRKAA
jgi:hypothetical protein